MWPLIRVSGRAKWSVELLDHLCLALEDEHVGAAQRAHIERLVTRIENENLLHLGRNVPNGAALRLSRSSGLVGKSAKKRAMPPSRSQVDAAGRRIRHSAREGIELAEEDLAVVRAFRELHLESVVELSKSIQNLRQVLLQEFDVPAEAADLWEGAARPKTEDAIVGKLRRSSTSLSSMQDISGARLVVPTIEMTGPLEPLYSSCAPESSRAGPNSSNGSIRLSARTSNTASVRLAFRRGCVQ
jgi:hypothetical protein